MSNYNYYHCLVPSAQAYADAFGVPIKLLPNSCSGPEWAVPKGYPTNVRDTPDDDFYVTSTCDSTAYCVGEDGSVIAQGDLIYDSETDETIGAAEGATIYESVVEFVASFAMPDDWLPERERQAYLDGIAGSW